MIKRLFPFLFFLIVLPLYAQQFGGIRGVVVDSTNVILPGATVRLQRSGSDSIDTVYTSGEGRFEFSRLKIGTYTVTVEMPGFETISAEVEIGSVIRNIQITLPEQKLLQEDVTVSGEASADLLQKDETDQKQDLGEQALDRAPIAEQRFQDALPLVPSVVRGPDGNININGARASESSLLVNGANVTDPVTGNFAIELPIEAVESVRVYTNPYSAEYGKFTGGVTSVSTKSGTERLKLEVNDLLPRVRFTDGFNTEGLESWSPRVRFSGPTMFKNLYFSQAIQYKYLRTFLEDLPDDANVIRLEAFDSLTQLDYRPDDRHQMTFTLSVFPQDINNAKLNTFLPISSTPNFEQRGFNLGAYDRRIFANGSFLESSFSYKEYDVAVLPKLETRGDFLLSPEGATGRYFNQQDRNSSRIQFTEAYTLHPLMWKGPHVLRVGTEYGHTSYSGEIDYLPIEIRRADGTLFQRITSGGPTRIGHSSHELSAYVQDHWTVSNEVTLDLGLRMDFDSITRAANFGPRAAFAYAPHSFPKTVFKGGIGLFFDKVYLNAVDFERYPVRTEETYDSQGNLLGSMQRANRMGEIKTPRSGTWNFEVNQQVTSKWLMRTGFMVRLGRDQFQLVPLEDSFFLSNAGKSQYMEWELTSQYRLSDESNLYISYVKSSARGDSNDFDTFLGNFQRPIVRENAYTSLSFNTPNRLLFWGVIKAPYKVFISPILEIRNGFPYSSINEQQDYVGERNNFRFPTFSQLDVRITRTFKVFQKYDVTLGMKVFNLMNTFNPRDVQNNLDSPNFGTFYNGMGRLFRWTFEIRY